MWPSSSCRFPCSARAPSPPGSTWASRRTPARQRIFDTRPRKFELGILFSVGLLVVSITVLRLPLILDASVSQAARSRVLWEPVPGLHEDANEFCSASVGVRRDAVRLRRRQCGLLL